MLSYSSGTFSIFRCPAAMHQQFNKTATTNSNANVLLTSKEMHVRRIGLNGSKSSNALLDENRKIRFSESKTMNVWNKNKMIFF